MTIYAMSDIHGCLDAFNEALSRIDLDGGCKLILLGDYVHGGGGSYGVIEKIIELRKKYGEKVTALAGNHEDMALDGRWPITEGRLYGKSEKFDAEREARCIRFIKSLPRYCVEGHIIFVHAGIDEDAGELWELGTDEYTKTEKFPADIGHFYGDWIIVAGHVGTASLAHDASFHDIYYDGESHYYIDGTVNTSGVIAAGRRTVTGFRRRISARAASIPLAIQPVLPAGISLPER